MDIAGKYAPTRGTQGDVLVPFPAMQKCALRSLVALPVWTLMCHVALAQTPPQTSPPPAEQPPPAPEQAAPSPPPPTNPVPDVDPELVEKARHHFKQGVAFTEAGNCEGAIVEFEASYRMVPRASSLFNIAQCHEQLHVYDLAIQYYERFLQEAEADDEERPSVEGALRTLRNLLGTVHIGSNVPAHVWIDDRLAGSAPGDVLVAAGRHILELRADSYLPQRTEIQVAGREEVEVDLTLIKARTTIHITETSGLDPLVFWSAAGATVITGVVGSIFGASALSAQSKADALDPYDPERMKFSDDMTTAARNADIMFAVTGVLGVATVVIAFLTKWDDEAAPATTPPTEAPAVSLVPTVGRDHAGLQLLGAL